MQVVLYAQSSHGSKSRYRRIDIVTYCVEYRSRRLDIVDITVNNVNICTLTLLISRTADHCEFPCNISVDIIFTTVVIVDVYDMVDIIVVNVDVYCYC